METDALPLKSVPPLRVAALRPQGLTLPWLLLNRDVAAQVGEELADQVRALEPGTVLVIDLSEVESRASCLAVMLAEPLRLIQSDGGDPEIEDRFVVIQGLRANLRDAHLGLEDEGLVAIHRSPEGVSLIGKVDRKVEETYQYARRHREVTSAMFVEPPFDLKISAANARVSKLHRLGLLRFLFEEIMETGGRRFVYQVVE